MTAPRLKIVATCTYPVNGAPCGHGFTRLWDKDELDAHMAQAHHLVWREVAFGYGWMRSKDPLRVVLRDEDGAPGG